MENQKMCDELLESIKQSQADKKKYFLEVTNGKHQGKKLVEHRIVIEIAEAIGNVVANAITDGEVKATEASV